MCIVYQCLYIIVYLSWVQVSSPSGDGCHCTKLPQPPRRFSFMKFFLVEVARFDIGYGILPRGRCCRKCSSFCSLCELLLVCPL